MQASRTGDQAVSKAARTITILYADDDPEDRMFVQDAWEESRVAKPLDFVEDGEDLMDYLGVHVETLRGWRKRRAEHRTQRGKESGQQDQHRINAIFSKRTGFPIGTIAPARKGTGCRRSIQRPLLNDLLNRQNLGAGRIAGFN